MSAQNTCANTYMKNLLKIDGVGSRPLPPASFPLNRPFESICFLPISHAVRQPCNVSSVKDLKINLKRGNPALNCDLILAWNLKYPCFRLFSVSQSPLFFGQAPHIIILFLLHKYSITNIAPYTFLSKYKLGEIVKT